MSYLSYSCFLASASLLSQLGALSAQQPEKQVETSRCPTQYAAPQKIERIISECQEDIKLSIIQELLDDLSIDQLALKRQKRQTYSDDEKQIAGCLLQCVYKKVGAVNEVGLPIQDGLLKLFSEGVQDQNYVNATRTAIHKCLSKIQSQEVHSLTPGGKVSCEIAYDVFECVSSDITNFCISS